ncbi:MAG TPA: 23S rRNA (uracil(1939)-C(5))-methyltransferase RlmD [Bacteroidales bacterium]
MGRKNNLPLIRGIEVTDIAAEGKAIAKIEGMVIFIPYVVPGDVLDVQVTKKRKNYMEALPVTFHKYSEQRQVPVCEHFGVCGGCKWQNLPYDQQLFHKQKQVADNLVRIGKLEIPGISPILPSDQSEFYRNKLEFTFSNNRWLTKEEIDSELPFDRHALGFHIPEKFDKILDIKKCWLQRDPSNSIRDEIKRFAIENGIPFFDLRSLTGFMRSLFIRTANTGELMVILSFFQDQEVFLKIMLNHIAEKFPEITSLMYVINQKVNDTITDQDIILFKGKDHIIEEMEGLKFKVGPKSFYQTNSEQAYKLYKVARDFARLTGDEIVYDLYTGTGTIANFVAHKAKKVIGIEYVPEAIEDARENSRFNDITNTDFYAGDIKDVLNQGFIERHGHPDVIILDPPRAGVHQNVIDAILYTMPERIVYVSCNPATQARDLALLRDNYRITAVQPVDMFPHTHHVENVVKLERI